MFLDLLLSTALLVTPVQDTAQKQLTSLGHYDNLIGDTGGSVAYLVEARQDSSVLFIVFTKFDSPPDPQKKVNYVSFIVAADCTQQMEQAKSIDYWNNVGDDQPLGHSEQKDPAAWPAKGVLHDVLEKVCPNV